MTASAVQIREYAPGDETAILEAFHRVFAGSEAGTTRRSLEHWRWKFDANPAGRRIVLAVTQDGRVAAHYAGIPARAKLEDRVTFFDQPVDSFSDPDFRAGLKRPGLFVHTGWDWYERYGGVDRDPIIYGYPLPAAWRVGHRFLGYELVRPLLVLFREPPLPSDAPADLRVRPLERAGDESDLLWERASRDFEAGIVRDATYLNWRYADRPDASYRILLAEDRSGPRGLAVLRTQPWFVPQALCLCDWVVPVDDGDAFAALLQVALRETVEAGLLRCCAFVPESSRHFLRFQDHGFRVTRTDYIVVARSYVKRLDMEWLRRNWFTTIGDSDLV